MRASQARSPVNVHDRTEAEDMAQETFLRAFRNLDLLADADKFGIRIRRIAFGVCIDWLRVFRPELYRSSDRQDHPAAPGGTDEPSDLFSTIPEVAPSLADQLELRDLSARAVAARELLPERYRTPLRLYHLDGLRHAKVAEALGLSAGTVRSLVTRARARMAHLLRTDAPVSSPRGRTESRRADGRDVFDDEQPAPRMLHVLNGDSVAGTFRESSIPGDTVSYPEVLYDGPVPPDEDEASWRAARERFLADTFHLSREDVRRDYEAAEAVLARFREYDEVVLWFEHDLYDQLLLVRHLAWFARRPLGETRLSLICVGEYPGVQPFHGLGQLTADQLASLAGTRQRVTVRQTELGRAAWRAFTGDDPTRIERVLRGDTAVLPFLAGALQRHLAEFPSTTTGLPRTERQILDSLASGPLTPRALFAASQSPEERIFMGDWSFWWRVRQLAASAAPLVTLDVGEATGPGPPDGTVLITDVGRAVREGRNDWIRLAGFDRWLGGVNLVAAEGRVRWRWDASARRLVPD